jgi:misacylated tRNA(Ala) deacylase
MTELLYLVEQTLQEFEAAVVEVDEANHRVLLDRTAFYPTGGGQPHDVGTLEWADGRAPVGDVAKDGDGVWHTLLGGSTPPPVGAVVSGEVDWDRRHRLLRTHTAMHVLCGVIWNEYHVPVTGGNMEPLKGRMDFEFDPLPEGFGQRDPWRRPPRSAASRSPKPNRRARATSGSGSTCPERTRPRSLGSEPCESS